MSEYSDLNKRKIKSTSTNTRWNRRIHRIISITVALVLLISAVTGLLLSWKKNFDILQPESKFGLQTELKQWRDVDELASIAEGALDSLNLNGSGIDRLDFRPDKGMVKVLFNKGFWEVQVDCTSGEVLSVKRRYSDLIEKIHDGSIISDGFKLGAMNVFGLGLLFLITTGFLLWYGPRKIRKLKSM